MVDGAATAPEGESAGAPAGASAPGTAPEVGASGAGAGGGSFAGVLACFVLSGFAALLYQTAWMRQFSVVLGTSELAVATVLASYMAGLALGSGLAARFVKRVTRPVLVYGLLELGIALGALAVPLLLKAARGAYASVLGGQPAPPATGAVTHEIFFLACAFLILAVPTALMGATLPLLTRHAVRTREQIGRRVGWLYAMNTAGAIGGTLAAAFVLLPRLGLWGTVLVGAAVNAIVFVIAVGISRASTPFEERTPESAEAAAEAARSEAAAGPPGWLSPRTILPLILLSGSVSFLYEVLWTRLLGHLLGASVFAFATMLASFLTGITLGSAIAARFATDRRRATIGFAVCQFGTALLSIGIYLSLGRLPDLAAAMGSGEHAGLFANVVLSGLTLLPSTLCIGGTFPFAVRILAREADDAGPASARVYAWNTVGAIIGAVLAGFLLVPALGYEHAAHLGVALNLALGAAALAMLPRETRGVKVAWGAAAVIALVFWPGRPESILRASPFINMPSGGPIRYYAVGRSATVIVLEQNGSFIVRCNGLPEASISPVGSPPRASERFLTALPVLARPDAEEMLVIGLGGGVALEGVPRTVKSVDVIELEHEVVEANRRVAPLRLKDPLADPRMNVIVNDARGALSLTDKRYDVIVSQPSHPWTAGASHLYTREFMTQAREHLTEDGVLLQWMNIAFVDAELLRILGATLLDVFPHVRLYRPNPGVLLFLASTGPLDVERGLAETGRPLSVDHAHYNWIGVNSVADVAYLLVLDGEGVRRLCDGAPVCTDDFNRLATYSASRLGQSLDASKLSALLDPLDPLIQPWSDLQTPAPLQLDRVAVARRLASEGYASRGIAVAQAIEDPVERRIAHALVLAIEGDRPQSQALLRRAIGEAPDDARARFALVEPWLPAIGDGTAESYLVEQAAKLDGVEGAIVEGWKHLMAGDWDSLRALDETLGAVPPSYLFYGQVASLRAQWRIQFAPTEPPLAGEAVGIIDSCLSVHGSPYTLNVRASAVRAANLPRHLLETVRQMANFFEILKETGGPEQAATVPAHAANCLGLLGPLVGHPAVTPEQLAEVQSKLEALMGV